MCRRCRRFGQGLHCQRIILEAKHFLGHTHLTMQSVGLELGFDDRTNFVKFSVRKWHDTSGTPVEKLESRLLSIFSSLHSDRSHMGIAKCLPANYHQKRNAYEVGNGNHAKLNRHTGADIKHQKRQHADCHDNNRQLTRIWT